MKVIDAHVHAFPVDIMDEFFKNFSEITGMSLSCSDPSLEGLRDEYEGHDLLKCAVLAIWDSTQQFDSENLRFMAESDIYFARHYFYSYHQWLSRLQKENDDAVCFGNIHPDDPEMMEEFGAMVERFGLKGMKMGPCINFYRVNDKRLFPAYEKAEAQNIPVILHTGGDPVAGREIYGHPMDVGDIASAFPKLTLVMAHLGAPFFEETREILQKHKNVYTDLSFAIDYEAVMEFCKRQGMTHMTGIAKSDFQSVMSVYIEDFGFDRVLYGSDFPYGRAKETLNALLEMNISDEAKEMILWKNAKEVLQL